MSEQVEFDEFMDRLIKGIPNSISALVEMHGHILKPNAIEELLDGTALERKIAKGRINEVE